MKVLEKWNAVAGWETEEGRGMVSVRDVHETFPAETRDVGPKTRDETKTFVNSVEMRLRPRCSVPRSRPRR